MSTFWVFILASTACCYFDALAHAATYTSRVYSGAMSTPTVISGYTYTSTIMHNIAFESPITAVLDSLSSATIQVPRQLLPLGLLLPLLWCGRGLQHIMFAMSHHPSPQCSMLLSNKCILQSLSSDKYTSTSIQMCFSCYCYCLSVIHAAVQLLSLFLLLLLLLLPPQPPQLHLYLNVSHHIIPLQ